MKYRELAVFFERLEATPGRLEMTAILVEMLQKVPASDMRPVVRLLQGAVAPDWEGLELGLAEKQILKVLVAISGGSPKSQDAVDKMEVLYHEKGDLGLAAETVVAGSKGKQASLLRAEPLTVRAAFDELVAIARVGGQGSQDQKQGMLRKLLSEATPLEARFLTRLVAGRLRLGVADMTFLDALVSWHLGRGVRSVADMEPAERAEQEELRAVLERAYDLRSDMAVVAEALAKGGPRAVAAITIEPGVPLRPMAAERLKTLPAILEKMGGRLAMEYKYDGLRIQAHVTPTGIRLFSRRMEELTAQFPDVVANLKAAFPRQTLIVEGEAIAFDDEGRLRPFQDISRRRGRKTDLEAMSKEIPITLFLFDCLASGGKPHLDETYSARRRRVEALVKGLPKDGPVRASTLREASDADAMEAFFQEAVEVGAEGIMCKDLNAPYKAGSRGFAWVKYKTDYTDALVDTMDLVAIGAFFGRGRRGGWYGALLMGAYDEKAQTFASVCKLGTGFDDATLESLKTRFAPHVSPTKPRDVDSEMEPDVWFHPALVMEVQAAELTLSPIHRAGWNRLRDGAGLAARFPRFTGRWRDDKAPRDATTVEELVKMAEA